MSRPLTIVAIIAAYNEEDIIADVVRALIAEGLLVYFLDHHSTDGTRRQIEPFEGRGVIGIETFPAHGVEDESRHGYAWEQILRRKEELSQTLDADWFLHHDADEFRESPWSRETLREGIQRVDAAGYNAIDFQLLNFVPTMADPGDGGDIRDRLLFYEPGRIFDHQQIKCWKKTDQPVVLTESGGHSVEFADRRVFPIRFVLRHYPIRSQAHGERKVFGERLPRFVARERARGWHVQYDDVFAGASFVRDPASLRRYDPEAVRLDLFLGHREVERLERIAAEGQAAADRLTAQNTDLHRHLQAQDEEINRLRSEREHLHRDLEALRRHIQVYETELNDLRPERERLQNEIDALHHDLNNLASLRIGGALTLARDIHGTWNDRWAGTELRFRAMATRPFAELRIAGFIAAEQVEGQDLRLRIDGREWTYHAAPGKFEWLVPINIELPGEHQFLIMASCPWRPGASGESPDNRDLAWCILDIEGR